MSTVDLTARFTRIRAGENPSLASLTPGHREHRTSTDQLE